MAKTLDDIFDDDDLGLLNINTVKSDIKTDNDRLIDAFEEINNFYETMKREPSKSSMSEYSLASRLNELRINDRKKSSLKAFDRFNLLGDYVPTLLTLNDIIDDDDLGLLEIDGDSSIFEFNYTPKYSLRDKADYVATRKSISEDDFTKYEKMFKRVHQELKEGKRKFKEFKNAEKNLKEGNFYLVDGLIAYLEVADIDKVHLENKSGDRVRLEGRTVTIFENATISNMLFRSLGKAILKNGMLITDVQEAGEKELFNNVDLNNSQNLSSGWIYVLKSQSNNPDIANIKDLHKIGLSRTTVQERIKSARNSSTYLYDEVIEVYSCEIENVKIGKLENLIHRFFSDVRLDIEINNNGYKISPREWFKVPLPIIKESIKLIINGNIVYYRYDNISEKILLK